MAVGNRYRITDAQVYLSQGCLNVYHYKQIAGTAGSASDLLTPFIEFIIPDILALQMAQLTHVAFTCVNLDDLDDYAIVTPAPALAGTLSAGDPEPSYIALEFQFIRSTRASRHGWKRIAGVSENGVSGNDITGTYPTAVNTAATAMFSNVIGAGGTYTPVIVRRNIVPALSVDFPVADVVFKRLSTQNTRKAGRGM